ncbi:CCR4-NOT transcription complex subunit 3 isoform X3 [Anopheles sinensis]|uniref:CCR4-NOT transcription complex subunit 3 isoform X3 n=1 Tax=Anopheles sinensis TaxID=74873 RepID=A0A084WJ36_ANOSI|nr:CCR4-NOT transcription complex subunit 3 isoform X3 [Anopheles sinensis]
MYVQATAPGNPPPFASVPFPPDVSRLASRNDEDLLRASVCGHAMAGEALGRTGPTAHSQAGGSVGIAHSPCGCTRSPDFEAVCSGMQVERPQSGGLLSLSNAATDWAPVGGFSFDSSSSSPSPTRGGLCHRPSAPDVIRFPPQGKELRSSAGPAARRPTASACASSFNI